MMIMDILTIREDIPKIVDAAILAMTMEPIINVILKTMGDHSRTQAQLMELKIVIEEEKLKLFTMRILEQDGHLFHMKENINCKEGIEDSKDGEETGR